jgi:pyrroline-5-carboxylate reductase
MQRLTQQPKIAFIGGGNMGSALIGGLVADGVRAQQIVVAEPDESKRATLAARFGVRCTAQGDEAVRGADVVVLAVKPQGVESVARDLAGAIQGGSPLVISVAAGIRERELRSWLGADVALVRSMPNTPSMIQAGATVLHAGPGVSKAQRDLAESILRAVGLTLWVDDETMMDAVTALSGSGPAYFFYVMEALQQVGVVLGLTPETARLLTLQTAMGAAKMALESQEPPGELRRRVTSPGGTTERALEVLDAGGLTALFEKALTAARDRSRELSEQLGGR